MIKLSLLLPQLAVALVVAAKNDVRYYLNGVHLNFKDSCIEATNGHFAIRIPYEFTDVSPDTKSLILPREEVQKILRDFKPLGVVELNYDPETRQAKRADGMAFSGIDGKFPDLNIVMPQEPSFVSKEQVAFAPEAFEVLHKVKTTMTKRQGMYFTMRFTDKSFVAKPHKAAFDFTFIGMQYDTSKG